MTSTWCHYQTCDLKLQTGYAFWCVFGNYRLVEDEKEHWNRAADCITGIELRNLDQ